jgi:sulfide:quinone oxidoreductase
MRRGPKSVRTGVRHVVIAGGGVAGLETLLALRDLAGHRIEVTMIAPERAFLYRPLTVGEPYDRSEARSYDLGEILAERPADHFLWTSIARVLPDERIVTTAEGAHLGYDSLVVAVGAIAHEALPGAVTFRGRSDVPALRAVIDDLLAGRRRSIAFVLPSGRAWPLAAYELALMAVGRLRDGGASATVTLVTAEERPLELFGPAATSAIETLLGAEGIALRTRAEPERVTPGALVLAGGEEVPADAVVTLPVIEGPRLVGVPCDDDGFIPVGPDGRVDGCEDVFAAGDVTAYPLKQGGLAAQQADVVAARLAADAGAPVRPEHFTPVLRGLLMTGGAPLYLRAEPHWRPARTAGPSVASTRLGGAPVSDAAGQPLWWPPSKIAGRYLAPFLASAHPRPFPTSVLADRPSEETPAAGEEIDEALELALMLADCDARWGDLGSALEALAAAEAIAGSLPPEYEAKRRQWVGARRRS